VPGGIVDPVSKVYSLNGEQRNQGVELNGFGELARGVRLLGGVTWLDAKQRKTQGGLNDGRHAVGAPELQANLTHVDARYENFMQGGVSLAGKVPTNTPATVANLWVGYAITPQLQASAGVRHVGKVYANAANTQWQSAYTLLDLGLAWKINKTSTLTGRIRNATDRVYAANLGSQAYLGAPRTADVTLHVAF